MTVSKISPVNDWSGDNSTTTFDFDFLIEKDEELVVKYQDSTGVQTTLNLDIDYTINEVGSDSGSYITFPIAGSSYTVLKPTEKIILALELDISQEKEIHNSNKFSLSMLEWCFDYLTRLIQILNRKVERAVKIPEGSDIDTDKLATDLNKVADSIDSVNTVAEDVANVDIVAADKTNIDTVAGSIGNVNIVAPKIGNVNTVASSISNVNTVAGAIANVNKVGTDIVNVNTVANDKTNIDAVAANKINIDNVAGNKANIDNVAGNKTNINTVAGNNANVTTVAGSINNVNTVAGAISNVNNVGGSIANVNKVAADLANIQAIVSDLTNIDALAGVFSYIEGGNAYNPSTLDIFDGGSSSDNLTDCMDGGDSVEPYIVTLDYIKEIEKIANLQQQITALGIDLSALNSEVVELQNLNVEELLELFTYIDGGNSFDVFFSGDIYDSGDSSEELTDCIDGGDFKGVLKITLDYIKNIEIVGGLADKLKTLENFAANVASSLSSIIEALQTLFTEITVLGSRTTSLEVCIDGGTSL